MKRESTIPTALAFIGFILVAAACFFFVRNYMSEREEQSRLDEANEVGVLADIKVNINGKMYNVITYNSKASQIFLNELPVDLEMDSSGNFKVGFTYFKLPVEHTKLKNIKTGDVLIIDDSHIAIATKSFETSDRYTLIGHIEKLDRVPGGKILVSFMKN